MSLLNGIGGNILTDKNQSKEELNNGDQHLFELRFHPTTGTVSD